MLMDELVEIINRYCDLATFAFVYILEAHANDEWPINELQIPQHKTLQDRIAAAANFFSLYPLPSNVNILLDNQNNDFNETFSSWPFRYWIIHRGRIALKSMPEGHSGDEVSVDALRETLNYFSSQGKMEFSA
jgi:hypothetical protein